MDALRELLRSEDVFVRRRLAYGGFIGRKYPYFYMETPKAACTATKAILWQVEDLGPVPRPDLLHVRLPTDPRPSPLSVSEDEALAALSGRSAFRFFVWRDPVDRLRSAFHDKIHLARDPGPEWDWWRSRICNAFGLRPDQAISFEQFAEFVCATPDDARDEHFMSQHRLLLIDRIPFDYVVRTDDYVNGMTEVLRTVGVPRDRWPPLERRYNETGSDAVPVSDALAAKIRHAFRAGYEIIEAYRAAGAA